MKNKKIFSLLGMLALVVIAAVAIFAQEWLMQLFVCGGGELLCFSVFAGAAETVQGTVAATTVDAQGNIKKPEVDKDTVSKKLAKLMPSKFPLDTITREMPKGRTKSDIYRYASVLSRSLECMVSETPKEAKQLQELKLSTTHMISLDSNLLVPNFDATGPTAEATPTRDDALSVSPLILHVVGINHGSGMVSVIALNASTVPAIPASTHLYRTGVAKDQHVAMSEDPMVLPTFDQNYCQINMATVSEAYFQKLQEKEVEWNMKDMQESTMYDFRLQSELAMLFGYGREFVDPVTHRPKYTMDGFIRKIPSIRNEGTGVTSAFLNKTMAQIYESNNGSEARICFYGSDFGLSMANNAAFEKQLEAGKTRVKFGITFNEVETNQGTLLMKKHDAFKLMGYGNAAMVIDPANFRKIVQKDLSWFDLDLEKAGKQRTNDRRIDESFTLEVTNPETHALIIG